MSRTVEKQVHLSEQNARRLEELAAFKGIAEEALIEQALEKLLNEERAASLSESDHELEREIEAEFGTMKPDHSLRIDPARITESVPVYIDPSRLKHEAV
jgi:hypothetical protein